MRNRDEKVDPLSDVPTFAGARHGELRPLEAVLPRPYETPLRNEVRAVSPADGG